MSEEPECTCPCIDCIEGNHCGGQFWWPDEPIENEDGTITEPELVGECHHISDLCVATGRPLDLCECSMCRPDLWEETAAEDGDVYEWGEEL